MGLRHPVCVPWLTTLWQYVRLHQRAYWYFLHTWWLTARVCMLWLNLPRQYVRLHQRACFYFVCKRGHTTCVCMLWLSNVRQHVRLHQRACLYSVCMPCLTAGRICCWCISTYMYVHEVCICTDMCTRYSMCVLIYACMCVRMYACRYSKYVCMCSYLHVHIRSCTYSYTTYSYTHVYSHVYGQVNKVCICPPLFSLYTRVCYVTRCTWNYYARHGSFMFLSCCQCGSPEMCCSVLQCVAMCCIYDVFIISFRSAAWRLHSCVWHGDDDVASHMWREYMMTMLILIIHIWLHSWRSDVTTHRKISLALCLFSRSLSLSPFLFSVFVSLSSVCISCISHSLTPPLSLSLPLLSNAHTHTLQGNTHTLQSNMGTVYSPQSGGTTSYRSCVCMCMCVNVTERGKERERESAWERERMCLFMCVSVGGCVCVCGIAQVTMHAPVCNELLICETWHFCCMTFQRNIPQLSRIFCKRDVQFDRSYWP